LLRSFYVLATFDLRIATINGASYLPLIEIHPRYERRVVLNSVLVEPV